jgi:diguanylate cyclase (GGDEF)-like protein
MKADRILTIRSTLALLVTACVLPALLMAMVLIPYSYQREKSQLVRDSIATARALAFAVDKELASAEAALLALATSPHLDSNDFSAFYAQAQDVLRDQIATNIVLTDASGQQRINTLRPLGEPLPGAGIPQVLRIFETGKPTITDLFVGPVSHRPLVAVAVPVRRGNAVLYSLSMAMGPERLANVFVNQRLPADWIGSVFDSAGNVVARTHEMERFVGRKGASALIQRMTKTSEDAIETDTIEGIPVVYVFSRSTLSNWSVAIGIPRKNLTRELWHSLWWIVLASAALLASGLCLAWVIGGRIAASFRGLAAPALALGSGGLVVVPPFRLKEAVEVGNALIKASEMLRQAQHQAQHDLLTGLPNRMLFNEFVNQQLALCRRTGANLAILYIDLDGFKSVNDVHGHATGDKLLRAVATRLRAGIRESDIAARVGGDEFAIALAFSTADGAATVAAKLVADLAATYLIAPLTVKISASIGIAVFPDAASTFETLLRRADEAMYKAKAAGKQRFAIAAT